MAKRVLVIDFETANFAASSACAIGAILIEDLEIKRQFHSLIQPPSKIFQFTHIHGITWNDVKASPTFKEVWEMGLGDIYHEADLLVAHNIGFDSRVLKATAAHYAISLPEKPTACTVKIARGDLEITPAKLDHVCKVLDIPLKHHEALSDSLASAYIYLFAKTGKKIWLSPRSTSEPLYEPLSEPFIEEMIESDPVRLTKKSAKSPKKKLAKTISHLNSDQSKKKLAELLKTSRK